MSTVTIPPVLTSPRDDAMHLYRAFKGTLFSFSFSFFFGVPSKDTQTPFLGSLFFLQ